jgi:hypothetical protein
VRNPRWDYATETLAQCEEVLDQMARTIAQSREHLERSRKLAAKIDEVLRSRE